jgi:formylglycine-generating enzyme required for sulfatase activity
MSYQQNAVKSTHSRSIAYARSAKRYWHSTKELLCAGSPCEGPRHEVLLLPFRLATRPVTNRDWIAFMEDDGYRSASLWQMDGSAAVQREEWDSPLYGWKPAAASGLGRRPRLRLRRGRDDPHRELAQVFNRRLPQHRVRRRLGLA